MADPARHTPFTRRLMQIALAAAGLGLLGWQAKADPPPTPEPAHRSTRGDSSTTDHSRHAILQGDFADGPAVTRACITCHTEAPHQIMGSIHWTWSHGEPGAPETEAERRGKRYTLNNFCGNLETNDPAA